ncbi:MAG: hypothetical protein DWH81_05575 [Planctomycetota bacterium]|nr:MAG: hypothetical protein DWH81_05575 [Planctomycetota bacterium]
MGYVKGKVTINGKPLAGADIEARPIRGRPAYGIIQPDGSFEIMYKKNIPGTLLGKNHFSPVWPTSVRGPSFPDEYLNIEFNVKPGENTFVLEMKSDSQTWVDFEPIAISGNSTITPVDQP